MALYLNIEEVRNYMRVEDSEVNIMVKNLAQKVLLPPGTERTYNDRELDWCSCHPEPAVQ